MTIALGILATDGVVLAADSEISTNGVIKGTGTKLIAATQEIFGRPPKAVGVAGAGTLGYFQSLRAKILMITLASMAAEPFLDSNVEHAIEGFMADFYSKHVIPFAGFPEPPDVALLIATWMTDRGMLWATERMTVRPAVFGFDAIGIGAAYALDILNGYACPMSVESAALLACYVMLRVKSAIANCGKDTQLMILRNGASNQLDRELIKKCEGCFETYALLQTQTFYAAAGVSENTTFAKEGLDAVRQDFDRLRQDIKARSSAIHGS